MITSKSSNPESKEPLTEMLSHLGRPCAVPLIIALGERAYNTGVRELRQKLDSGSGKSLSESAISKCLTDLTALGLVQRTDHADSFLESRYSLTHVGQEIYKHILQMRHWAENVVRLNDLYTSNVSAC